MRGVLLWLIGIPIPIIIILWLVGVLLRSVLTSTIPDLNS